MGIVHYKFLKMKRILSILAVSLFLVMAASVKNPASSQVRVGAQITYQDFYDELSPYGQWMEYPEYGYVWMPNVGADFRPYSTNGRWVWSDEYEWMWASDYNWGWAPFHYGRWFLDPTYGWMWVPGYDWSPAWVAWRDGGDYYGWAPIRPGISIGINFSIGSYAPPVDYWCFAPRRYIASPRIYNYCLPSRQNVTIINNTTIINNYRRVNNTFVTGPRRGDAERYAGNIRSVRFRELNSPGRTRVRNNEVSFYRPNIRRDNNQQTAPRNFERYNNRNGQNGGGRENSGTGWRQTNERNNNNGSGQTGWSQVNGRRDANNNGNERVNANPQRDDNNRGTGWRQMNERRNNAGNDANNNGNNNANRLPERRGMFDRQPVRQSDERMERPSAPRTMPVERTDRSRPQIDRQPQPERRVIERRDNSNNDVQRRMNMDRPARQQMPQMSREPRPQPQQRQMESRPNRGGGEGPRGFGRRRD